MGLMKIYFKFSCIMLLLNNYMSIPAATCGKSKPTSPEDCWKSSSNAQGCCYLSHFQATSLTAVAAPVPTSNVTPLCRLYDYTSLPKTLDRDGNIYYSVKCPLDNNPFFYYQPCTFNITQLDPSILYMPNCQMYNENFNYCCKTWGNNYMNYQCFYSNNSLSGNFTVKGNYGETVFICTNGFNLNSYFAIALIILIFLYS